ncbi:hypothetical protein MMC28_004130 [Mycoblastus sanguinarius]|nr:hypothetical protein [Mycoblastus sanguinarius]
MAEGVVEHARNTRFTNKSRRNAKSYNGYLFNPETRAICNTDLTRGKHLHLQLQKLIDDLMDNTDPALLTLARQGADEFAV